MGPRRKASQAARGRGVPGPEGVFDFEEKAQEEQQGLICALMATLHPGVDFELELFVSHDMPVLSREYRRSPDGQADDPVFVYVARGGSKE